MLVIIIIIIILIIIIIIIIIIVIIADTPCTCICGDTFSVDYAMYVDEEVIIIQRHNELRDLETGMLYIVCHDVQVEPVL